MPGWTLLALTLAQTLAPPPAIPEPKTAIAGRVLDSNTGLGIPRANVSLKALDAKAGPAVWMRTSNTGDFSFDNLQPGLYTASAERSGYSGTVSTDLTIGTQRRIYVEKDQNVTDLVIRLAPHSVITGKVTDDSDDPVAFAAVHALRCTYTSYDPVCETASMGITNDLGEYRLAYLPPGRYLVRAENSAYRENLTPGNAVGKDADSQLVSTYFPQTADPIAASVIDLGAGKQVGGIEVRLQRATVHEVQGRTNPILSGVTVEFVSSWFGKAQNPYRQTAITDGEGRFTIKVPAGPYTVIAQSKETNQRTLEHRSRLRVRGDLENFVVPLTPLAGLQATVMWPESGPSPNLRIDLRPLPGQSLTTGASGTFDQLNSSMLENIAAGEYALRFSGLPTERYIKAVRVGGIDGQSVMVGTGSRVSIEVEVAEPAASLEGVAVDRFGKRMAATQVLIWKAGSGTARTVLADGAGEWRLGGLGPGDYRLLAVEMLDTDPDPAWLLRQEAIAEPVTLQEGTRAGRILLTRPAP